MTLNTKRLENVTESFNTKFGQYIHYICCNKIISGKWKNASINIIIYQNKELLNN